MSKFNFIAKKHIAFIISAVLLLVGIVSFVISGFNLGVDFVGGAKVSVTFEKEPDDKQLAAIEEEVKHLVGADKVMDVAKSSADKKTVIVTVSSLGSFDKDVAKALANVYDVSEAAVGSRIVNSEDSTTYFTFKLNPDNQVGKADVKEALDALIEGDSEVFESLKTSDESVTVYYNSTSYEQLIVDSVDDLNGLKVVEQEINTISKNRASAQTKVALWAAVFAIVLMFIYIAIRFAQFSSALAAVVCLFFNLFVMFAFYSVFGWELTLDIIPACLTILGYSINATIVIFDRIRENLKQDANFNVAANSGVHSTMLRSLNTTITTLITIVLVYILGVESIRAFALPLIIGIVAGLFSSVFLAAPLWGVFKGKDNTLAEIAEAM